MKKYLCSLFILFASAVFLYAAPTHSITLEWDESPDTGVGAYRIHWGTISGAYTEVTNAGMATTITIQNLIEDQWYYFVATAVGTNQLESDFSNEVTWRYSPTFPITIITQPITQRVIQGSNVTLTVAANGTQPFYYQWFKDTFGIAGATAQNLTINNFQPIDVGAYNVTISNNWGIVTSEFALLSINAYPAPPQNLRILDTN